MAKAARYEDSPADRAKDRKGAKKAGLSLKAWEKTAADRKADATGQKALNRKRKKG